MTCKLSQIHLRIYTKMSQQFYLLGEPVSSARHLPVEKNLDLEGLQYVVAAHFAIVEATGTFYQPASNHIILTKQASASKTKKPSSQKSPTSSPPKHP